MIVVDTHVIIWNALKPGLLTPPAQTLIKKSNETDGILISDISIWEIAMLLENNRISIPVTFLEFIHLVKSSNKYQVITINPEIAEAAVQFPSEINQDPADRIICATAKVMNVPLITADKNLRKSKLIKTIW